MSRLASTKMGNSQITLNKIHNTYIKLILKYGRELFASTTQLQFDSLGRDQKKALWIITEGVKRT